jgi:hypothetical protein
MSVFERKPSLLPYYMRATQSADYGAHELWEAVLQDRFIKSNDDDAIEFTVTPRTMVNNGEKFEDIFDHIVRRVDPPPGTPEVVMLVTRAVNLFSTLEPPSLLLMRSLNQWCNYLADEGVRSVWGMATAGTNMRLWALRLPATDYSAVSVLPWNKAKDPERYFEFAQGGDEVLRGLDFVRENPTPPPWLFHHHNANGNPVLDHVLRKRLIREFEALPADQADDPQQQGQAQTETRPGVLAWNLLPDNLKATTEAGR